MDMKIALVSVRVVFLFTPYAEVVRFLTPAENSNTEVYLWMLEKEKTSSLKCWLNLHFKDFKRRSCPYFISYAER
jgi:hypothetical protein